MQADVTRPFGQSCVEKSIIGHDTNIL